MKNFNHRYRLIALSIIAAVIVAVTTAYLFYRHYYPTTDDAYVNANIVYISAEVSGKADQVLVSDHQRVKAGDLLLTIDRSNYEIALAKAEAQLAYEQKEYLSDKAAVNVALGNLDKATAKEHYSDKQSKRILPLVAQGILSKDQGDQTVSDLDSAKAAETAAQASLDQARQTLAVQQKQIDVVKANLASAKLNLLRTKIYAPADGVVSNFSLRPGAYIASSNSLFAIVDNSSWWLDANFKETELGRIHPGQKATVTLDMYPGITFQGRVESISAGSGSTFSLLPPENASGNWVKVTQRFVVKIHLTEDNKHPFRVGASANVEVNTLD